ncbi:restriction endonuclease [Streptomyces sp. NPDC052496]|uniref:restriction endonuclease n=1 Tax=Streptomyces sp. NPDC052496 TaxID=3154951 RepID=UPI0034414802
MIIDATSQVAPRRYKDKELRQMMGDLIGKASPDDLLACFLWAQEGRIGSSACRAIANVLEQVEDWRSTLGIQLQNDENLKALPFAQEEYKKVIQDALWKLQSLHWKMGDALREVQALVDEMRSQFGTDSHTALWRRGCEQDSPLEAIAVAWDGALELRKKAQKVCKELDAALGDVRRLNDRRSEFSKVGKKYTLANVDSFDHKNFEVLVAWLAGRDGMKSWRTGGAGDLGADVIAEAPDGRRFVFQCKHTSGRRSVDSAAVQRLNGTARPVHRADEVVMVTSGDFSKPAREFARSQKIHLVDRQTLKKWSEWGDSLYSILKVDEPRSATEGEAA